MNKTCSAILLLGGSGSRSGLAYNKALHPYFNKPLFIHSLQVIVKYPFDQIIIVHHPQELDEVVDAIQKNLDLDLNSNLNFLTFQPGSVTRHLSVINGLLKVTSDQVIIFDGARPYLQLNDIKLIHEHLENYHGVSFYHPVTDCIKIIKDNQIITLDRDQLRAVTTPQGFTKESYPYLFKPVNCFDELSLLENTHLSIGLIKETHPNPKLTNPEDFNQYRIGHSLDYHSFDPTKKLILGGVKFDHQGLKGHSDADGLLHSITEAIIGGLGLGDIGTFFPDTDPCYYQIDSSYFIIEIKKYLTDYQIVNIDSIIYLEKPNLKNYKPLMEANIAKLLDLRIDQVNVKATTMEKKGVIGNQEGIACETLVLLQKI